MIYSISCCEYKESISHYLEKKKSEFGNSKKWIANVDHYSEKNYYLNQLYYRYSGEKNIYINII